MMNQIISLVSLIGITLGFRSTKNGKTNREEVHSE